MIAYRELKAIEKAKGAESRFIDLQEVGGTVISVSQSEINSPRHTFSPQDLLLFLIHASAS